MEKDKKLIIDEKSDDLEITSIGSIYWGGHWDKKYWSSSRGKDRYPYPVGYQAIRTHAGHTYRMEIHEGLKGPVFVVISPGGDSYVGQTPDIAWENFQKKSCPKVKNWLGKRFSSKMDGVELFGFRNPFVQRLLRELVAKVNGVADGSFVAPTSCNKASKFDSERIEQSCTHPELLPYIGKKHITGKRSLKNRSSAENLIKEAKIKRTCSQLILNNRDCTSSKESIHDGGIHSASKFKNTVRFQEEHLSTTKDVDVIQVTFSHLQNLQGDGTFLLNNEELDPEYPYDSEVVGCASSRNSCDRTVDPSPLVQVNAANIVEENCHSLLSVDAVLIESKHSVYSVEKNILFHEQSSDIADKHILTCASKMPLEKPVGVELELRDSSPKNSNGEHADIARYPNVCVPDTCDTEIDGMVGSTLEGQKASLCSMKNEPVLARSVSSPVKSSPQELANKSTHDMSIRMHPLPNEVHVTCTPIDTLPKGVIKNTLAKGVIKDSLPEAGSSSGSSNQSSEKIDLDLAGQELARSMMTFLLPRAVPLLTKTYVKRRSRHRNRENKTNPCSTSLVPITGEQVESKYHTDMMCQGNNVAKALVLGPEVKIRDKMNSPQESPGADSLCQVTRVEPFLAGCMTTQPFIESGSSKDIQCVIQDSFEDVQSTHHVSVKRQDPPRFNEVEIASFNGINGNVDSPILPENNSERLCFCSGNDGNNGEILLLEGNKDENSLQAHVPGKCIPLKEAFSEECTHELVKVSSRVCNCLGSKCSENTYMDLHVIHNSSLLLNLECAENINAESNSLMPNHDLSKSDKAEHSYQGLCFNNKLGDEVSGPYIVYSSEKDHNHNPNIQVNFDVHAATDYMDVHVKNKVGGPHITHVEQDIRDDSIVKGKPSLLCKSNVLPSGEIPVDGHKIGNIIHSSHSSEKCIAPLSEIIICRKNTTSKSPKLQFSQMEPDTDEEVKAKYVGNGAKISLSNESQADEKLHHPASRNQDMVSNVTEGMEPSHFINPFFSRSMNCVNSVGDLCLAEERCMQSEEHTNALGSFPWSDLDPTIQLTTILDSKGPHTPLPYKSYFDDSLCKREDSSFDPRDSMELVGSYLLTNPVLSLSLTSNEDGLQICVLCGLVDSDIRNIFMYMIPAQGSRRNSPSFLGYTSLMLSLHQDSCYRNIPFERSEVQFISGLQSLVFLNSVKAPRCMERSFDCSCRTCTSNCCEENTVEIVHLNFGYVSSVIKLIAMERISSILACEPNYLIAVEQSGNLHVWVMNLEWSVNLEEFMLPKFDEHSPEILELKTIPNCNFLFIGHNGFGSFALWDISKRVLLAKFSSPGITTFEILPVGLFKWQSEVPPTTSTEMDCIKQSTFMTDKLCPKAGGDSLLASFEGDIAVWLLVSADSNADAQHQVKEPNIIPLGCWRLGLLVRNMVVLGSILDPRASAVISSSHYGIYGTCDGFLYKWELSSGQKVAGLHPFKCGSVSHIAIDAKSGAFAVANNGCQLLVYAQPPMQQ